MGNEWWWIKIDILYGGLHMKAKYKIEGIENWNDQTANKGFPFCRCPRSVAPKLVVGARLSGFDRAWRVWNMGVLKKEVRLGFIIMFPY